MKRDNISQLLKGNELELPAIPQGLTASISKGETIKTDGTNVVRVPFGIRQPRKKRPDRPERSVTLILPFQTQGQPTPPPQAA